MPANARENPANTAESKDGKVKITGDAPATLNEDGDQEVRGSKPARLGTKSVDGTHPDSLSLLPNQNQQEALDNPEKTLKGNVPDNQFNKLDADTKKRVEEERKREEEERKKAGNAPSVLKKP